MVARLEAERLRIVAVRAPAPHFAVAALVATRRHRLVRQVRHLQQPVLEPGLHRFVLLRGNARLVTEAGDFGQQGGGILAARLQLSDRLRQRVAPRLQVFGAHLQRLALGLQRAERVEIERMAAKRQARGDGFWILAKLGEVEHGARAGNRNRRGGERQV